MEIIKLKTERKQKYENRKSIELFALIPVSNATIVQQEKKKK